MKVQTATRLSATGRLFVYSLYDCLDNVVLSSSICVWYFWNGWILYVLVKVGVKVGAVIDTDTETDKL